jgi:hypothetical protein
MITQISNKFYAIYNNSNITNGVMNTTEEYKNLRSALNKHSSNLFTKKTIEIYDIYTEIDEILTSLLYINKEKLFISEIEKRLLLLQSLQDLYLFETKTEKQEKQKKQKIPAIIKKLVWNTYIGEDIGKSKCMCCKKTDITQLNFICGHVISEHDGGSITVENMRPICGTCNLSMGTRNMNDFILNYFYE